MIDKQDTEEAQRTWDMHWQFVLMMHAACMWPDKWDASEVLGDWWPVAFPGRALTDEEFTTDIFDRVRAALAERGGVTKPILPENCFTEFVHAELEIE